MLPPTDKWRHTEKPLISAGDEKKKYPKTWTNIIFFPLEEEEQVAMLKGQVFFYGEKAEATFYVTEKIVLLTSQFDMIISIYNQLL